ncbi:MAG: type II toxin-antitoxin system VapC family toxin [Thermoanaerobaculales bacterium]
MRVLLDTNVCIRVLNGTSQAVVARLQELDPGDVAMSAVVRAELVYGARKSLHLAANLRLVEAFCEPFVCLPFDDRAASVYGEIRADLERRGQPIGPNDLLIASTTLVHSLTLVTHNTSEFARVPGLTFEDWEA